MAMPFLYNDGGRQASGYKGQTGDCAVRAIAIATGMGYQTVYDGINQTAKRERPRGKASNARTGVWTATVKAYLSSRGWRWVPTMGIGQGCTVHLRADELPAGRIIVRLSGHYAAVVNGVINDTFDDQRDGTRCVYGYFIQETRVLECSK